MLNVISLKRLLKRLFGFTKLFRNLEWFQLYRCSAVYDTILTIGHSLKPRIKNSRSIVTKFKIFVKNKIISGKS